MKRLFTVLICLWPLFSALSFTLPNEESGLMGVLEDEHSSLQEKDAACARLKWIGTQFCVPYVAKFLTDPQLSQSARNALESMPYPAAGDALRQALTNTSGSNEVGIINSLGVRAEATAASDLVKLLSSPDAEVAVAAAEALGRIGGPEALKALQSAWDKSNAGTVHNAQSDALLACANRLLKAGAVRQALEIFQKIYDHEKVEGVRLAAFRGIILSSEKRGITLMIKAIQGKDGPGQGAALQLASTVGGPATTRALAGMMPKLSPAVQIALLQALDQRHDRYAVPGVAQMFESTNSDVRLAAITAMGDLRDGRATMLLVRTATSATGAEKTAARQALLELVYGSVTETLLDALPRAPSEMQAELIRALGDRGDASAAPKLLELAQGQNDSTRSAALQALALVAGNGQIPGLVQLVVNATNDDVRSAAADALGSACQHIEAQRGRLDVEPLVQAVKTGPMEARVALLGVCSGVSDPQVRDVLRKATHDEQMRGAAIRAMCESQDKDLLPDMLTFGEMPDKKISTLAIRGCVRVITQDQAAPLLVSEKINALKLLMAMAKDPGEKRLVLSGLASVPDKQTLDMAASLLNDAGVKVEAAEAVVQIARAMAGEHPTEAAAALKRVVAKPANADIRKSAQAALKKIKPAE